MEKNAFNEAWNALNEALYTPLKPGNDRQMVKKFWADAKNNILN